MVKGGNVLMKKKLVIGIIIGVLIFSVGSYFSKMTLLELFPMLTLDKCVEISGEYRVGTQTESTSFVFERDSKEFERLFAHFYWSIYEWSFRNMLPQGTRYHKAEPDDFQWNVYFTFEGVEFPDGSTGSGKMLHIENWYGDLDIYFDGERYACKIKNQDDWLKDALNKMQ